MALGIGGVKKITLGTEGSFGTPATTFYDLRPVDYERLNIKQAWIDKRAQVRPAIGNPGGFAGLHELQDSTLKFWGHANGTEVSDSSPGVWTANYLYQLFGACGMPQTTCYGFSDSGGIAVAVAGGVNVLTLTGEGGSTAYTVGSGVVLKDKNGAFHVAVITAYADSGALDADLDITLDRTIASLDMSTADSHLYGGYQYKLDTGNVDYLTTDEDLKTLTIEQEDFNSKEERFTGVGVDSFKMSCENGSSLFMEFGLKAHKGAEVASLQSATAFGTHTYIQGQGANVCFDGTESTGNQNVELMVNFALEEIPGLEADQGRSGYILKPDTITLTLTGLQQDTTTLLSTFQAGTEIPVSVIFANGVTVAAGQCAGFYCPKCQITDGGYQYTDGEGIQTTTVTMDLVYDSDTGYDLSVFFC